MAGATMCNLDGRSLNVEDAISLRDAAKRNHEEAPVFTCVECGKTVRPHRAGTSDVAHFEHHARNPQCSLRRGVRLNEHMAASTVPEKWKSWCTTGRHGRGARKRNAVLKCLKSGQVRGYFSDMVLNPDLDPTDSMYPSLEHLVDRENHAKTVVEARIFNDMKSHLSEDEFSLPSRIASACGR